MMVAYRAKGRAVFLYGFAKNERENVDAEELTSLRKIATDLLVADAAKMARALAEGVLQEIDLEEEDT